ncbi:MAG: hypothetical protein ACRETK_04080 [Steroidobacteraceae bacterium]
MTALTLKPEPAAAEAADKQITLPAVATDARRRGAATRMRRRITAMRLVPTESGFHPFRVN